MLPLLYTVFILSGAAGLIYESIWTRYLGLFVGRQLSPTATHPVGLVDLGYQDAGSHRLAWNLEVAGERLAAGSYLVLLEVFTADGHPSGIPPTSTYAFLTITGNDRTSVRLVPLKTLL